MYDVAALEECCLTEKSLGQARTATDPDDARKFAQFVTCVMMSPLLIRMLCMLEVSGPGTYDGNVNGHSRGC